MRCENVFIVSSASSSPSSHSLSLRFSSLALCMSHTVYGLLFCIHSLWAARCALFNTKLNLGHHVRVCVCVRALEFVKIWMHKENDDEEKCLSNARWLPMKHFQHHFAFSSFAFLFSLFFFFVAEFLSFSLSADDVIFCHFISTVRPRNFNFIQTLHKCTFFCAILFSCTNCHVVARRHSASLKLLREADERNKIRKKHVRIHFRSFRLIFSYFFFVVLCFGSSPSFWFCHLLSQNMEECAKNPTENLCHFS